MTKAYRRLARALAAAAMVTALGSTAALAQDAILSGTYQVIDAQGSTLQTGALGSVTFDGAGNYTASFTDNSAGTITVNPGSGTYTVAPGGGVTISVGGGGQLTGYVSSDGNTIVVGQFVAGQSPEIDVAIKQNGGSYTNNASGALAFHSDTTGVQNSAFGSGALNSNTSGSRNNAAGFNALYFNTTANDNNAMGANALYRTTSGALNNAVGNFAMEFNTIGNNNNAVGYGALLHNTTGSDNSAQGYLALSSSTTGNLNVAIGYKAGANQTTGSQNIYLGNVGVAAESGVIRIGSSSGTSIQSAAYVAGISGNVVTGGTVVVTASGQLGVASSSRRYKQDIEPLRDESQRLSGLRPVQFRYIKPDEQGQQPLQFGLIAEEVAAVLPELVFRNAAGEVEGVRYEELTPMLLSLAQQQQQRLAAQEQQLHAVQQQLAELQELVARLKPQAADERVALR